MQTPLSSLSHSTLPLTLLPQPSPPRRFFPILRSAAAATSSFSSSLLDSVVRPNRCGSGIKAVSGADSVVEEEKGGDCTEFVEVGYVCNVHGLRGELKVLPATDFPELRFCTPGKRWLRSRVMGEEVVREVELIGGRNHPGQKTWIIDIAGIDSVEKAKQIVGSNLLVKDDDKPSLEDGEFYNRDLLGMTVIHKDSGVRVGTVVDVANYGANDLLHVMLESQEENPSKSGLSEILVGASGSLVWIPFVEAIVPDVDLAKRVMQITPPKGLLELNLRSDSRSKKERSQLEWRKKKKFQKLIIAAKKKLVEIGQQHVLDGFGFGSKDEKSMLANQIANINFNLFQRAVKGITTHGDSINLSKFLKMDSVQKNYLRVSRNCFSDTSGNDINERHAVLENNGLDILHEHKVCIVIVIGGEKSSHCSLQISEFLCNQGGFMKVDGQRFSTPLLIVCSENELQFYQEQFSNHDYFGFDKEKVLFFEEEKLPVLKNSPDDQNTHRMLLSSPWEILQSPVGSGGVLSLLSSRSLLDDFSKWGIEYIQICSFTERIAIGHLAFLGLTCSKAMDVGVKIFDDVHERNEFDLIFSMKRLRKISKQADKIRFESVHEQNEHVELVDKEWIDVNPSMPNSICFRSSIYNTLDASHADTTCILHITDRL